MAGAAGGGVTSVLYSGPADMTLMIKANVSARLITINIDGNLVKTTGSQFKDDASINKDSLASAVLLSNQTELGSFVSDLAKLLDTNQFNYIPAVARGLELSPYWTTTDDRIIECPVSSIVHDETSPYQRIQILDTIDFGRMLLLDSQVQLSESDDIYTRSLMSDVSYTGTDVLILGGGDGALLAQLLTHDPHMVTMVELDGDVMRVVRDHMPSVARGVLNCQDGENHNIITGSYCNLLPEPEIAGFCCLSYSCTIV